MAKDFAKRGKGAGAGKPARKNQAKRRSGGKQSAPAAASGWRWYGGGVLTGVFLSFLLYLGTLPSTEGPATEQQNNPQSDTEPPKPVFKFYNLLREQTMEVELEVEPATTVAKPPTNAASSQKYLLQAGSFKQREDADRRRAELLLLGLDPQIEETNGDNGRWHRVYLGPFETKSKMNRARGLTANQNIDTLVLKRNIP